MSVQRTLETIRPISTGLVDRDELAVLFPNEGANRAAAIISKLSETVDFDQFTDGGAAVGTYQMVGSLPAGAVVLATKILVPAGFAGDTSAVAVIGDGTDADRYMTGTPSVFATAAEGVEAGPPSGALLLTADNRPTITVTSAADFTSVSAGQMTVEIYYIDA